MGKGAPVANGCDKLTDELPDSKFVSPAAVSFKRSFSVLLPTKFCFLNDFVFTGS